MTSSDIQDWLMSGHDIIFDEIMLMVGHSSLESLDICRQVCKTWNYRIMTMIWENPTKRWGTIIQRRIERSWGNLLTFLPAEHVMTRDKIQSMLLPSDEKITQVKLLGEQKIKICIVYIVYTHGPNLSRAVNLHHSGSNLQAISQE